jgi:hypothetical protein
VKIITTMRKALLFGRLGEGGAINCWVGRLCTVMVGRHHYCNP